MKKINLNQILKYAKIAGSLMFYVFLNASMAKYYQNPNEWYILSFIAGFWLNNVITTCIGMFYNKNNIFYTLFKTALNLGYFILISEILTEIISNNNDWLVLFYVCGILTKLYVIELNKILSS